MNEDKGGGGAENALRRMQCGVMGEARFFSRRGTARPTGLVRLYSAQGARGTPCTRFIESMTLALAEPFRGPPYSGVPPPLTGGVHRILRIPERGLEE